MNKTTLPKDSGVHMAHSAILRTVVLTFVLLLTLETFLQYAHNRDASYGATGTLVTNIQEILTKNEESIATLSDTLKEEYKTRVQSAAYALYLADRTFSVEDYQAMAQAMAFDEIHIFDREGRIADGSEPKYWGMNLDSGEQMAFFRPILDDYNLVLCQDVTPNTAEGKSMMYAMCWLPNHKRLVQIGITPERLLAEIEKARSVGLASQIPIADEGVFFAVADRETQALISTSDPGLIRPEESHFDALFGPLAASGRTQYRCTLAGTTYYVSGARFQDRYIVAAQSVRAANRELGTSTLILSIALLFSVCLINLVQRRFAGIEAGQRALLQESNAALAENNDIIACANMGIWHIILLEGQAPRMKANPKMRELLALPEDMTDEEEIYRFWHDRIPPEVLPSVEASTAQMMAGEQSENTYLWMHPTLGPQYVRCGGTALKAQTQGYILRGYHYNVNEAILREREHEKQMAQALHDAEQASIAKTTFLSHMSHDIRTPMNAIIGYTNIAKKQNESPAVAACLEKIGTSSDHLLSLINDVLDISRIESGKTKFVPAPVDLRRVIGDILSIARGNLEGRELTLREDWEISQPYVRTDALRIREIILNLLSNAIKFTPDGGTITFRLRMTPQAGGVLTRITVSDTGIGMSEAFQAHIFEEFSQESDGARTQYKGTGLGMPIVKRYLELMGGTIQVESRKGQGTTFSVSVPMALARADELPQTPSPEASAVLSGKRVLLAEDNELNAEIARYLLEELGMQVTHVSDGEQAVEAFLARPEDFDVILMDIMMPVMNGYEATRAIRRQGGEAGKAIPILAVTANSFAEDTQSSREAGMNGHISKPIQPETLKAALAACLGT